MRPSRSALLASSALLTPKFATLFLCILILSTLSFAAAPDRITIPVAAQPLVKLSGGIPLQAQSRYDQGRVDPSLNLSYMTLLTVPSATQQQAIKRLVAEQQDPHSDLYHKWLTPEQYADRFGLSPNDIQKLTVWLQSQGFSIVTVARGRNWIVFSGTAAQAERTFQTEIHSFEIDGDKHFANITAPSIPFALSGIVTGIRGLSNFHPKPQSIHAKPNLAKPDYTSSTGNVYLAPGDIATIYHILPLYDTNIDGTGQTLAVIGQTDVYLADLLDFRNYFGLSTAISGCTTNANNIITACNIANSFQYVLVGTDPDPSPSLGDLPEADLDIEWSGAVARNAQIIYVNSPNGSGVYDSMYYTIDHVVAPVMTMSYSLGSTINPSCELGEAQTGGVTSDEAELAKGNMEGITFMTSSGDSGAAGCDYQSNFAVGGYAVSYPASSPSVTAVGGTMIPYTNYTGTYFGDSNDGTGGSAKQYVPEQGWNDAQEWSAYCTATPTAPVCQNNPGLNDWSTAQENYIGIAAGGGGLSNCVFETGNICDNPPSGGFPQPTWQANLQVPTELNTGVRLVPDVALLASVYWPGFIICTPVEILANPQVPPYNTETASTCANGIAGAVAGVVVDNQYVVSPSIFGGTSVASPMFAGIVTLLNQSLNGSSKAGLGNINPTLYTLAANPANGAFHSAISASPSLTVGNNGAFCQEGSPDVVGWPVSLQCPSTGQNPGFLGFDASNFDPTTGYNLVSGLGSVDANNLAAAFANPATAATTTTLTTSGTPAIQGATVTFTATVTTTGSNPPTGTVTFNDGTMQIGTGTLNGSQVATFATKTLAVGTHSITAIYGGDTNNASSTSAPVSQVITAITTTTTLTASPNPVGYGALVTLTATVATTGSIKPTGTVTFYNGSAVLGMATLNGSLVATFITGPTQLAVGANSLTAVYAGDANNSGSTSGIVTENVTAPSFTVTNTGSNSSTVVAGQQGTGYAFSVAPASPATNFGAPVTLTCSFPQLTDPTLTATSCIFLVNGIPITTIPAATGLTQVTLQIATAGPGPATPGAGQGAGQRRRADNRSPWLPLALPLAGIVMVGFAGRKVSRHSAAAGLFVALMLLGILIACGGGSSTPPIVVTTLSSNPTLYPNNTGWVPQTSNVSATLNNTTNTMVNWSLSGSTPAACPTPYTTITSPCGYFSSTTTNPTMYTSPTVAPGLPTSVTIMATSMADPTKVGSTQETIKPATIPGTYNVTVTVTDPVALPTTQQITTYTMTVQ